jgi:hypothetical protein
MNIKEALQKAKTCAPLDCKDENVCFTLVKEIERLYALLEPKMINELTPPPANDEITTVGPTPENIEPLWEAA